MDHEDPRIRKGLIWLARFAEMRLRQHAVEQHETDTYTKLKAMTNLIADVGRLAETIGTAVRSEVIMARCAEVLVSLYDLAEQINIHGNATSQGRPFFDWCPRCGRLIPDSWPAFVMHKDEAYCFFCFRSLIPEMVAGKENQCQGSLNAT